METTTFKDDKVDEPVKYGSCLDNETTDKRYCLCEACMSNVTTNMLSETQLMKFIRECKEKKYCRVKILKGALVREEVQIEHSKLAGWAEVSTRNMFDLLSAFRPLIQLLPENETTVIEYIEDKDGKPNGRFFADFDWGGSLLGRFKDSEIHGDVLLRYGAIFVVPLDKTELVNLFMLKRAKRMPFKILGIDFATREADEHHILSKAKSASFVFYN